MFFLKKSTSLILLFCFTIAGFSEVTVTDTIWLGPKAGKGIRPLEIVTNEETNIIYVRNFLSHNISVIDGTTNSVIATIKPGDDLDAIVLNPLTNMVYTTTNSVHNRIYVIDGTTNSVVDTIETGGSYTAICIDTETNRIYTADKAENQVSVIDCNTNSLINTIHV
jgi:YVTN family beta-propeller protein